MTVGSPQVGERARIISEEFTEKLLSVAEGEWRVARRVVVYIDARDPAPKQLNVGVAHGLEALLRALAVCRVTIRVVQLGELPVAPLDLSKRSAAADAQCGVRVLRVRAVHAAQNAKGRQTVSAEDTGCHMSVINACGRCMRRPSHLETGEALGSPLLPTPPSQHAPFWIFQPVSAAILRLTCR